MQEWSTQLRLPQTTYGAERFTYAKVLRSQCDPTRRGLRCVDLQIPGAMLDTDVNSNECGLH